MDDNLISNVDIVVYVLAQLEGAKRPVSTEKIAYEAFQTAPDRFSWVGEEFSEYPDKEVARLALEDAAKLKNGSLAAGKAARDPSKDGWILTPEGVRWAERNIRRLGKMLQGKGNDLPAMTPREVKRFQKSFSKEPAFTQFQSDQSLENVTNFMFTDMLQCTPDASAELIRLKFDRLKNLAELAQESEVLRFLEYCEEKFFGLMNVN